MSEEIFYISFALIYFLLSLIILLFSLIIILTITCYWHTQFRSVSNLLICNSSMTFVLYAIICCIQIPFMFLDDNDHSLSCQLRAFFTVYTAASQILAYLSQAIFRYFSMMHYRRKILLSYRVNIPIILLGWMLPLIITAGVLASPYGYRYEPESRLCFLTTKYFFTSALVGISVLFTPITIIIILYGFILRKITHDQRQFQSNAINLMRYKRNLKVFHNIMISVVIIMVCGTPYIISMIINVFSRAPWIFYPLIMLSISFAAALESMVLFFRTSKIKEAFYMKIGLRRADLQVVELRRRDQINGNQIVPVNG